MNWSFNPQEILQANGHTLPAAAPAAPAMAAPAAPSASFEQLHAAFKTLPEAEQQQHLATMTTRGLSNDGMMHYLQNLMNVTPTGMELATDQAIHAQAVATGKTSIDNNDMARVVETARNLATRMMAAGASDKDIQQAVGNIPGVTMETLSAVQAVAKEVTETDKYNLFSTRNAEPSAPAPEVATIETASLNPLLQNMLTTNKGKQHDWQEELRRQQQNQRTPAYPVAAFASVNAIAAAPVSENLADALDFIRDSGPGNIPNARSNSGPGRSGGNGLG